jgi:hypothetical protein
MPWTVEDGSGVADANTYILPDDIREYASARGVTLPAVPVITAPVEADPNAHPTVVGVVGVDGPDPIANPPGVGVVGVDGPDPIAPWMVLAMDYLESLPFVGMKPRTTVLAWPREFWRCAPVAEWIMPTEIARAQAQLVIEQFQGIDLFVSMAGFNQGGGFITKSKVDVLETQYSEKVIPSSAPDMPAVRALLRDFVMGGNGLTVVRV